MKVNPGIRGGRVQTAATVALTVTSILYLVESEATETYQLVVWPFSSQENNSALSERLTNDLNQLNGSIDKVTLWEYEEYKARSIDPRRRIQADGHLRGEIIRFSVVEQPVTAITKSKRYQSGTEKRRNPDYDRLVFDIEELERREEDSLQDLRERQEKEQRINELERDNRDREREIRNGITELERMNRRLKTLIERERAGDRSVAEEIRRSNEVYDQETRRLRDLDRQMKRTKDEINHLRRGPGLFSLEREYDRARSAHSYAKRELLDTPEYLEEPIYEDYRYEVLLHRIRSYAEVQYQIDDEELQEPRVSRSVKVELNTEDEEIVQGHAEAGVERDPRELPSENEMRERAFQDLLTKLVKHITEDLQ